MTITEFSDQFDVLYNNITSNQAPGLDEYEKSFFLTKAEKEIVKNYFTANSKGNNIGQGFDDSAKRQADFSVLMKTSYCTPLSSVGGETTTDLRQCTCSSNGQTVTLAYSQMNFMPSIVDGTYTVTKSGDYYVTSFVSGGETVAVQITGWPFAGGGTLVLSTTQYIVDNGKIDPRSRLYLYPSDTFIVVNESLILSTAKYLQVIPLRYDEYTRLMSKPYKRPLKNQAWRLMNSGSVTGGNSTSKIVEIVTNIADENNIVQYNVRYVRIPKPIIVANLGDLSIDGQSEASTECEIDPILHEDILQRAVELAKVAWTATGQENAQLVMAAGQRSE